MSTKHFFAMWKCFPIHYSSEYLSFSIMSMDTLVHRLEQPVIEPPSFQLVENLFCFLSHSHHLYSMLIWSSTLVNETSSWENYSTEHNVHNVDADWVITEEWRVLLLNQW